MRTKKLIEKVLSNSVFEKKPPVLLDIGASGGLPEIWKDIAKYSICIAFDADTREFKNEQSIGAGYKKKFFLNRLVTAGNDPYVPFYLTRSPYCSSTLEPDTESLNDWTFHSLFHVESEINMPAVNLWEVIKLCGYNYIDWFKTDSQGTDLRLFRCIPESVSSHCIVAELEPGIIDAYKGEDKLHSVLSHFDELPFWLSKMKVIGSQRLQNQDLCALKTIHKKNWDCFFKTSPGWTELTYINEMESMSFEFREYLLAWVFSTLNHEHGFAAQVARLGTVRFENILFDELRLHSLKSLPRWSGYYHMAKKIFRSY
jgi:hypothetical protein